MMKPVLTAAEMKRLDAATIAGGTASEVLMRRAAEAVVDVLWQEFPTARVLFCCGPGNNGGDGFLAARLFAEGGGEALVLYPFSDENGTPDTARMSTDCRREYERLPKSVPLLTAPDFCGVSAVVDALFGIGLTRPLSGEVLAAVNAINAAGLPVLAVDIPSGINSDTGAVMGGALRATATVAIAAKKYGHILYPGTQFAGKVTVADIGVPITDVCGAVLEAEDLSLLPPRPARAHKGSFGRVLVVGGSPDMSGAAHLAAKAAYRTGAGLVEIFAPAENRLVHQIALPEALLTCYDEESATALLEKRLAAADAVAIGMGLSTSKTARALTAAALAHPRLPLVVDADALNLIAADKELCTLLFLREAPTVLTPHPAEFSRLTGKPVAALLADMPCAAAAFARESGTVTVFKDARTVIADGKRLFCNVLGNSGMATGGSGDVLAGVIASLLAQGATAENAATLGVLVHAMAGDAAAKTHGKRSLMASDIIEGLSAVLPD